MKGRHNLVYRRRAGLEIYHSREGRRIPSRLGGGAGSGPSSRPKSVDRYFSPESQIVMAMVLPSISPASRRNASATFAPDEKAAYCILSHAGQPARRRARVIARNLKIAVHWNTAHGRGDPAAHSHPLYRMIWARNSLTGDGRRLFRLHDIAANSRLSFFQGPGHAGICPAGAEEIGKGVDGPAALIPQFRTSGLVVGKPCAVALELVGPKRSKSRGQALRFFFHQFQVAPGNAARHGARLLVDQNHSRPQRGHHSGALLRISFRHDRHEGIALDGADNGKARAHIARRQFHDRLAGRQMACVPPLQSVLWRRDLFWRNPD